jgi:hypothetical protein
MADIVVRYVPSDAATGFLWILDAAQDTQLKFEVTIFDGHRTTSKVVYVIGADPAADQIQLPLDRVAYRRNHSHFVLTMPGIVDPKKYTFDELWRAIFSREISMRVKELGGITYYPCFETQAFREAHRWNGIIWPSDFEVHGW